jgi:uncharacterized protein (DUF2147 family)
VAGQRLGVVVDSSRCGKVVHGGATWWLDRGENGGTVVVTGRGGRKEAPWWGGAI